MNIIKRYGVVQPDGVPASLVNRENGDNFVLYWGLFACRCDGVSRVLRKHCLAILCTLNHDMKALLKKLACNTL